jgi:hypothetical protein
MPGVRLLDRVHGEGAKGIAQIAAGDHLEIFQGGQADYRQCSGAAQTGRRETCVDAES